MTDLRDSVIYQAIVEEGMIQERQDVILELGRERFGPASESVETAIRSIDDLERLRRMSQRLGDAHNWEGLLATP